MKTVFVIVLDLILSFYGALVLSCNWSWFVVPFGLPDIGALWAFGLMTIARLLAPINVDAIENLDHSKYLIIRLARATSVFIFGYAAHSLI